MKRLRWLPRLIAFCSLCFFAVIAVIGFEAATSWHCELQGPIQAPVPQPPERSLVTKDVKDYARPEDDTYLSFPEWYIVWSYQEKADFQESHLPSGFPYLGNVHQYWNSYACISQVTRGKYAFNAGEQVMLLVIGTSFSAEYILKAAYEKTIGRLSEWTSGYQPVEEDRYAYQVAREYADFVHIRPFYEMRFARHAKGVWTNTPLWGPHPLRKFERKLFLTADYSLEAFYCWLIEQATHVTYGYEPDKTYAWIEDADEALFQNVPQVKKISQAGPHAFVVEAPRYQPFTDVAASFAGRNVNFVEIAGNAQILVSVLAPASWRYSGLIAQQLFTQPILARPDRKRVVINCNVDLLDALLVKLASGGITVEHVYDY